MNLLEFSQILFTLYCIQKEHPSGMTSLQQFVFNFTQQLGKIENDHKKYDLAAKQTNFNYKWVVQSVVLYYEYFLSE